MDAISMACGEVVGLFSFCLFFMTAPGLHCGAWASHCSCFSCCGAQTLGMWAWLWNLLD